MPLVSCIVDTDGTGDYASLNAAEAANFGATDGDLVSNSEWVECECRCTSGSADTTDVEISAFTTDATYDIRIYTDPNGSYRHAGVWSTSYYRLVIAANEYPIWISYADNIEIDGLQIETQNDKSAIRTSSAGTASARARLDVKNCHLRSTAASNNYDKGIAADADYADIYAINNVVRGWESASTDAGIDLNASNSVLYAYNNTIHDCHRGIMVTAGTGHAVNNVVFGCTDDFNGTFSTCDHNASDDGDGTNAVSPSGSDWSNEFTDYSNGDFSILNTGNLYLGSAITQADDSIVPANDIAGTARNTGTGEQTSIGAFEYASAGATYQDTATDGLTFGESVARTATLAALASDGLNLGESIARTATLLAAAIDGLNLGESPSRSATLLATATDGLALGESPANIATLLAAALDGIRAADLSAADIGIFLTATDGLSLGDGATTAATFRPTALDGLTFAEALTVVGILAALASDGMALGDAAAGDVSGALVADAIDGLAMGDAATTTAQFVAQVAEALNLGDGAASIATLLAAAADGIRAGDAAAWLAGLQALASDGLVLGDGATALIGILAAAADGLTLSDTGAVRADLVVTATDGASFGATVGAVMVMLATAADTFSLGDLSTHFQAAGLVTMSVSSKKASITITVRKPGVAIN